MTKARPKEKAMARNHPADPDNIYRICRLRGGFSNQQSAAEAVTAAGADVSEGSLKDYERNCRTPPPDLVQRMAAVYGTPELEYMHCLKSCPLGSKIVKPGTNLAQDDIYRTYFQLVGAFNRIDQIQRQLHDVIADNGLDASEVETMDSILEVLDQIADSSKEIRIWVDHEKEKLTQA